MSIKFIESFLTPFKIFPTAAKWAESKSTLTARTGGVLEAVGEGDEWPVRVVGLTDRLPASKLHYLARNVEPPRSSLQSILDKSLSELVQPFSDNKYGISEIVRTSTGSCIFCPGFQVVSFHGKAIKTSEGTQVTKSAQFFQLKSLQFGLLYQTQHQTFFLNCFRAEVNSFQLQVIVP